MRGGREVRKDLSQVLADPQQAWDEEWGEIWTRYYWRLHSNYKAMEPFLHAPVLDVGCGPGFLAARVFPNFHWYTGIDISPKAVKLGRFLFPGGRFIVGDVENEPLPFKTDEFRTVVCMEVLEHIRKHTLLISEMVRVSMEYIAFTVPTSMSGVGHVYPEWSHGDVYRIASKMGTVLELHTYYETHHHLAWVRIRK